MKKIWRYLGLFCLVLLLTLSPIFMIAAQNNPAKQGQETPLETLGEVFPVMLDNQELFTIRQGIGSFSAQERAKSITARIEKIADDDALSPEDLTIKIDPEDKNPSIILGDTVIATITSKDAKLHAVSQEVLAERALAKIKAAIVRYRQERQPDNLLKDAVLTVSATLSTVLIFWTMIFISLRVFPQIQRLITSLVPGVVFQNFEIISSQTIGIFSLRVLQFIRTLIILTILYFYLTFVLRLFPWTRKFGDGFLQYFFRALEVFSQEIAKYLPNIFIILLIIFITHYLLRAIKPFFTALSRGTLVIHGFYPDWANPTYNLLSLLIIALAIVIAFPYLPGFNSPAFQGVSVFLGVLFSLGSTSAIANVVGGIILIYTRSFQLGDKISIGDVIGDVIEKGLLVTRIRTPANRIITIPNSSLLNTNVINFSVSQREFEQPLILQTTVTLGYDLPWRKVHETLKEAALATKFIVSEPAPFVLQTSLDDFYVSYQLNAYTDHPSKMVYIYSELHQNIQDKCNEVGIEIMSPHYKALRDGNHSTIPENYLPEDYQSPAFGIQSNPQK
ncbi:MAG: mechanosensitive ion channel family protein [Microcystis aeruginosa L111-01]|jgi:small-conductance mechanosensitive channel|uniref:mechanosensitive ion channel family protein n=1 Tax=Microcystis sp. LSC13-02 TaxID=1895004 RepID=UPI002579FDB9|nr:mechanosensitive ion channel family protein [Microcystis sp. LSC13-02]NCR20632.1 mechanosensitive ion channel family protein [Microcystis aeruginosa L111-01]NCR34148.1 mechanosensitive ion channel family protein [Microcystis aeruginosa S11-05]NCR47662.1 mechanosensitive ion channel family protein [Microcystis aeruginosa S11-01]NCS38912.1 mechanosensitive ion channel family protein [Microcystis aeruginosa BS13-10]NCS47954.1 mechanosensitive ion channel family protein [Microcystis aeruginosa 